MREEWNRDALIEWANEPPPVVKCVSEAGASHRIRAWRAEKREYHRLDKRNDLDIFGII